MFHPHKRNSLLKWILGASIALSPVLIWKTIEPQRTDAHEVEVSGDVGATMHIEPNDSPRAGRSNLVWFAVMKKGGQPVSLSGCNCSLAVYSQPRRQNDTPIQQPALQPTTAQGRQNVPSTNVTFPRAGAYELVLRGSPKTAGAFSPFELRFAVTVAQ
jgi:hypothetical protein